MALYKHHDAKSNLSFLNNTVKIEKFLPSAALRPFIKEFMILESDLETDSNTIPDTSMVMAFRYRGNVLKIEGERKEAIPATVIAGLRRSARIFYYSNATANLLVIFKEGGFRAFTAHSLTEASYEAGYFDQSHFIKDFRLFTGQTPKEFFKSFRYW